MQPLPDELWLHILRFLPAHSLAALYSVSHVFFCAAMDVRYHSATLGHLQSESTRRAIHRLRSVSIAQRVREFTFQPANLCRQLAVEHPGPSDVLAAVQTIMAQLSGLREFSVLTSFSGEDRLYFTRTSPEIIDSLFVPGWNAFAHSLTALDLHVPMEDWTRVFSPSLFTISSDPALSLTPLHQLESLHIRVFRASISTRPTPYLQNIIFPFIAAHSTTLRHLSLYAGEDCDLCPYFITLSQTPFPKLASLKYILPHYQGQDFTGIHQFISSKSTNNLTSFSVHVTRGFAYFDLGLASPDTGLFRIYSNISSVHRPRTPALNHLAIRLYLFESQSRLIPYIHQFIPTLVSLEIVYGVLEPLHHGQTIHTQLESIIQGFRWRIDPADPLQTRKSSSLRHLCLKIELFDVPLLSMLAEALPELKTLAVDYQQVVLDRTQPVVGAADGTANEKFVDALSKVCFPDWKLQEIRLSFPNTDSATKRRYKEALVRALPSVEWFGGFSKREYLESAELV